MRALIPHNCWNTTKPTPTYTCIDNNTNNLINEFFVMTHKFSKSHCSLRMCSLSHDVHICVEISPILCPLEGFLTHPRIPEQDRFIL